MMSRMVSLRVDATPERAFEAFVREIGRLVAAECGVSLHSVLPSLLAFEPWLGGRLTEAPAEAVEIGCITAWEPAARLAFTRQAGFAPDQLTQVEEPIGSQMCVTVEHRGRESTPQDRVARYGFPMRLSRNHMANGASASAWPQATEVS